MMIENLEQEFNKVAEQHKKSVIMNVIINRFIEQEHANKMILDLPLPIKLEIFKTYMKNDLEEMCKNNKEEFDKLYERCYNIIANSIENSIEFGL